MHNVYIGYDAREHNAYRVCVASLVQTAQRNIAMQPINYRFLGDVYTRPHTRQGAQLYDVISGAPMSTEFSIARFFTPYMAGRSGWALFCDCDFMFRDSIDDLFALADDRYAVMVVKHPQQIDGDTKMDGQAQTRYSRKNWSSLMLFNLAHPKNHVLDPDLLNRVPGIWLHQFTWLADEDIGELPAEWNYLVGVSPFLHTNAVRAAHFTLGTPDMPGYEAVGGKLADEWRAYAQR